MRISLLLGLVLSSCAVVAMPIECAFPKKVAARRGGGGILGSGSRFAAAEWPPAATCCPAATLRAILAKKAASGLMQLVLLDLPMAATCPILVVGSRALRFHPGSSSLLRDTECPVVVVIVVVVADDVDEDEGNDDAHLGDEGSPFPPGFPWLAR